MKGCAWTNAEDKGRWGGVGMLRSHRSFRDICMEAEMMFGAGRVKEHLVASDALRVRLARARPGVGRP